jgi:hypothetical protein
MNPGDYVLCKHFSPSSFGVRAHLEKYPISNLDARTKRILLEQANKEYDQAKQYHFAMGSVHAPLDDLREAATEVASLATVIHSLEQALQPRSE